ncbi:hypothetical protein ACF1A5_09155 [Streptomyces sp. NPDC014864]|uniref:hypothetical protein n=1 Tax=Streptomyces sp. NPDC014864 TaxID=3364924 RepID=UPI0036FC440A
MPGTVLLLAASPVGRGRLVDAASVLPVLAAVPPAVLSGTDTATVVELVDPLEPQAVLTRLRAAAAAPGPLTVFVTGQLQLDRRQRLPHLALARTAPATVRYTALPWHWLREELRLRPDGTTTVLADLHADPEAWARLRERPLDSGRNIAVYGRIAPPPSRRTVAVPSYMKAVATLLRSGHRPPPDQLHQQALARLADEGGTGSDLVLTAQPPVTGVPYPATAASFPPGRYPAPAASSHPDRHAATAGRVPAGWQIPRAPVASDPPAATAEGVPAGWNTTPRAPVASDPIAATAEGRHAPQAPVTASPLAGTADGVPAPRRDPWPPGADDPHAAIAECVRGGRHGDADALAARWEQAAVRAHGTASEEALHWAEVRADLAMLAGDAARSCRAWLTVATTRLALGQSPDTPEVEAAVDRAHHQWGQLGDPARARELGPEMAELRGRVPGRRQGALDHVRRQLRQLQAQG